MSERGRAWVEHLRRGGTTPWSSFDGGPSGLDDPQEGHLPGAQQLELLRRLNLAGSPSPDLVERVVRASAPGRGRPDLELVGAGPERRFGPRPVDPAALPDAELLRVATGLIALSVVRSAPPPVEPRRPRRWRTRYELVGDPYVATPLTAALAADGRPPGGPGRAVLVLGADLPTMLARVWADRTLRGSVPPWPEFVARVHARDQLPRRVDLAAVAARQRSLPGTGRVSVVLEPHALPGLLGVRTLPTVPPDLTEPAGELARRVATAVSLHVTPPQQADLLERVLLPRLVASDAGPRPVVPPEHRDWVEDAAARLHRDLTRAGYPVVGDPGGVLPGPWESADASPTVLDLAVRLLLDGPWEGVS
ncbi:hypothetical protein [Nocardioides flavescens]|uniref:Uncharacterized protein n=1 Tax=Nocardioides flavescens TaxID=2691959 RepID=A0A6L7EQP9_9ACTN|nr:hypothetical protein [Nocardioides flavescens]MXG88950.1 hypothetical protein [Nocardioides flavescens]